MIRTMLSAALAVAAFGAAPAAAQQGVELGVLECTIEGGTGFIIGSEKDIRCTFNPADQTFAPENYFGGVRKWGLDIGHTDQATMRWLVLAPSSNIYAPGALAGDYVGASAEVTAAVGAGANLLVGGMGSTFTLQPLSLQTQTGYNLAVGVTRFQLRSMDN
jgi:predicted outer membrane protein